MNLAELLVHLEALAPLRYAESWDNVGLLVGQPHAPIRRVLCTVDYTHEVAEEAYALGADVVIAYHPPIFSAVKRIPHDEVWVEAIRRSMHVYSPHTALDVALGGTNDVLADACGMHPHNRAALQPFAARPGANEPPGIGLGRVGNVDPCDRAEWMARIKQSLGLPHVLLAGPLSGTVRRIAVAAGSGGSLLEAAIAQGADTFVTGELSHHAALSAVRRGLTIACTLHSNSERMAIRRYAATLNQMLHSTGVAVTASEADRDPFRIA